MASYREARREESLKLVAQYRASGLSVKKWCEINGVNRNRMKYWLSVGAAGDKDGEKPQPKGWVQAIATGTTPSETESRLAIQIGKATITITPGFDPELLRSAVQALSGLC